MGISKVNYYNDNAELYCHKSDNCWTSNDNISTPIIEEFQNPEKSKINSILDNLIKANEKLVEHLQNLV